MKTISYYDRIHALVKAFLESNTVPIDDLQAFMASNSYHRLPTENPRVLETEKYVARKTCDLLKHLSRGDDAEALAIVHDIVGLLSKRDSPDPFDGDSYRLGAAVAERTGDMALAQELEVAYARHQERFADPRFLRYAEVMEQLFANPEALEELAMPDEAEDEDLPVETAAAAEQEHEPNPHLAPIWRIVKTIQETPTEFFRANPSFVSQFRDLVARLPEQGQVTLDNLRRFALDFNKVRRDFDLAQPIGLSGPTRAASRGTLAAQAPTPEELEEAVTVLRELADQLPE